MSSLDPARKSERGPRRGRERGRPAQRVREIPGRGPSGRVRRQRAVDDAEDALRQVGAKLAQRPRSGLDRARGLEHRATPERMSPRERLPQHHADGPDVRSRRRLAAREPLGRDVRERPGDIAGLGQRLSLRHLRETEVEHACRNSLAVHEQDVRGLDVPMQDAGGMSVGEPVAHLRAGLDRRVLGQPAATQGLAEGVPGDELVRDVDVA